MGCRMLDQVPRHVLVCANLQPGAHYKRCSTGQNASEREPKGICRDEASAWCPASRVSTVEPQHG